MITLEEAKTYLKVDFCEDDGLIQSIIAASRQLVKDAGRMDECKLAQNEETAHMAMLYAIGYLYENRSNPDLHALTLNLRSILFAQREGII